LTTKKKKKKSKKKKRNDWILQVSQPVKNSKIVLQYKNCKTLSNKKKTAASGAETELKLLEVLNEKLHF